MFPSLSKAFHSAPYELGNVPMIVARSGAERGNNEWLEKSGVPLLSYVSRQKSTYKGFILVIDSH